MAKPQGSMTGIGNTEKFTGLADVYARFRPGYPIEAIRFLKERCHLDSNSKVADIGCGTGIFSRLLHNQGIENVIGVEPNQDMLRAARIECGPDTTFNTINFIPGTAEDTTLDKDSIDTVVSAQAFHWFDAEKALEEFHRILKNSGHCALIWNVRDDSDPFTREYGETMYEHSTKASDEIRRGVSGKKLLLSSIFESLAVREFPNSQILDEEGIIGRAISTSYAPRQEADKEELIASLKKLYDKHRDKTNPEQITMRYITTIYLARKRSN